MKSNLPITQVETLLPEGEFIYSSTDLKGVIVEANEAFCRVSNFTREEMIGKSHNIVRHPEMPPAARPGYRSGSGRKADRRPYPAARC